MGWDEFASGVSTGGDGQRSYLVNKIDIQEVTVSTGATAADTEQDGPSVNYVPREGGDKFHRAGSYSQATSAWQSDKSRFQRLKRGTDLCCKDGRL